MSARRDYFNDENPDMAEVTLSRTVRNNLLSLTRTTDHIARNQNRLSEGLSVGDPIDDAVTFFQAKTLSDRASDLSGRKDGIDQAIGALKSVLEATGALEQLVRQVTGAVNSARSGTKEQRAEFGRQINELVNQIQKLVDDTSYQGLNLLNSTSSSLSVRFSEKVDSKLVVEGVNFNVSAFFLDSDGSALGLLASDNVASTVSGFGFDLQLSAYSLSVAGDLASFNSAASIAVNSLEKTIGNLRAKTASIASNVAILQVHLDFTTNYVNLLQDGAGKLTLADLDEEGANALALQTRRQIGLRALQFAGNAERSILNLFRS